MMQVKSLMKHGTMIMSLSLGVLIWGGMGGPVQAESPHAPEPGSAAPPFPSPTEPEALRRDPTLPSPDMLELLNRFDQEIDGTSAGEKLPELTLRGRVIGRNGDAMVALEVDGRIHLMRENQTLTTTVLRVSGTRADAALRQVGMPMTIRVHEITPVAVSLRLGPDQHELVLH